MMWRESGCSRRSEALTHTLGMPVRLAVVIDLKVGELERLVGSHDFPWTYWGGFVELRHCTHHRRSATVIPGHSLPLLGHLTQRLPHCGER